MKMLSLACLSLLFVWPAFGQQVKVLKVKGTKAVIRFPKNMEISKGQTLTIGGDEEDGDSGGKPMAKGSRNTRIGLEFEMTSLTIDQKSSSGGTAVSADSNKLSLSALYGWNKGWAEYGPIFSYSSDDDGSSKSTTMDIGGFFEYNFKTNKPGEWMVMAAGAQVAISQMQTETTSATADGSGYKLDVYFAAKLFPWSDTWAFTPSLGYRMASHDFDAYTWDTSGLVLSAAISAYF